MSTEVNVPGVISFAVSKMGEKVGDGQCTTLVEQALIQAGKLTTTDFGVVGTQADYVWGTPVTLNASLPGDIIQFRDHVITVTVKRAKGGMQETTHQRLHHTAILTSKGWREDSRTPARGYWELSILEQNHANKKRVIKSRIQLQSSWILLPNDDEIDTHVSGQFTIFRPEDR